MKPQRGKHETLNALAAVEDLSFSSVQPVKALAAVEGCSFSSVQPVKETCNDVSLLAVSVPRGK
jgi:hypothetical protein